MSAEGALFLALLEVLEDAFFAVCGKKPQRKMMDSAVGGAVSHVWRHSVMVWALRK